METIKGFKGHFSEAFIDIRTWCLLHLDLGIGWGDSVGSTNGGSVTASLWVPHCHPLFSAKTVSSLRAPIVSYICLCGSGSSTRAQCQSLIDFSDDYYYYCMKGIRCCKELIFEMSRTVGTFPCFLLADRLDQRSFLHMPILLLYPQSVRTTLTHTYIPGND